MATVTRQDVRIHYETVGSGSEVVLLHGMGSSYHRNWVETGWVQALVDGGHRVVGIDARGHGASTTVRAPGDLTGFPATGDIEKVLDAESVGRVDVVGYSMGAGQALRFALDRPARVARLVLGGLGGIALAVAGGFTHSDEHARGKLAAATKRLPVMLRARGERAAGFSETMLQVLGSHPLQHVDVFAGVDHPTLLVAGSKDTVQGEFAAVPVTAVLEGVLPSSRREIIDDADHLSCVRDGRFMRLALEFLQAP